MISDATNDNRTNSPEHLQHLRRRSSQPQWHNLTAVGGSVGDEDTPGNAFEDLRQQQDAEGVAEVEDEDEAVQEHQAANGRPSVSDLASDGTCEEDTDQGTNWATTLECRLPRRCDEPFILSTVVNAIVPGEALGGDEVAHEEDAVRLHDLFCSVSGNSPKVGLFVRGKSEKHLQW